MIDETERLLRMAKQDALRDVVPPGADRVRQVVRRRRGIVAGTGAAVAAITTAVAVAGGGSSAAPNMDGPADSSSAPTDGLPVIPEPDASTIARMDAAATAMGTSPWVMATNGVVSADYQNDVNDIPAEDYRMFVYCVGEGTVRVTVKADDYARTKLAEGSATCSDGSKPAELKLTQPHDGYLHVFLSGDAKANAGAAFAFKFVRLDQLPPGR
jgi:hypothetical protein